MSSGGIPHITKLLDVIVSTCIIMSPIINGPFTNEAEAGCDNSCPGLWAGCFRDGSDVGNFLVPWAGVLLHRAEGSGKFLGKFLINFDREVSELDGCAFIFS